MSFASDVRAEIARDLPAEKCCARSELAAALLAAGGIAFLGKGHYALSLVTEDAPVARHFFALLKRHFDVTCEIRTLRAGKLNGRIRYQVLVPEADVQALLAEMQLLDEHYLFNIRTSPAPGLFRYACCRAAFLRGAFLLCGAISNPEKDYHLEFASPNDDFAESVLGLLNYFEITAKKVNRKTKNVVYLKSAEQIANALSALGAGSAVLRLENIRVKKDVRNYINRQMNCDTSNINRVVQSAAAKLADIRYIDEQIGLDKLPASLREIAEARLNNPEASLSGLGDLLTPPLGKSGVNARLRRLSEIADRLRSGEEVRLRPRGDS